ncbi:MAG: histidinol-phosphate transaminase [Planctomycetota bacterium]
MPAKARDNIERLDAYVPGEQPGYAQTSGGGAVVLKFNTNESPYPPSDAVLRAVRGLSAEALRLYPPADAAEFRAAAAAAHGLTPGHVIATNGGDELLRLLITVFCEPGNGGIGTTAPSYTLYPVLAAIQDTPVCVVDRVGDDFALPGDLAQRWNDAGCRLAFLVNPHAPTGRLEPLDTVRALAEAFDGLLVVDEAYVDFAEGDALPLLRDEARGDVVILRSLSKGYGLAGLRFGYGLADPTIIATLDKARDSYNTDIVAQVAATAAVRDVDYARSTWQKVIDERARLTGELRRRGFAVPDSASNFVLAAVPGGGAARAEAIYRHCKTHGVLIRYFGNQPRLGDRLRITVGTPAQTDRLLGLIDSAP